MIPQLIFVFIVTTSITLHAFVKSDQEEKNNRAVSWLAAMIIFEIPLLWWGGFFDVVGIPELIYAVMNGIYGAVKLAQDKGAAKRQPKYVSYLFFSADMAIFYYGGFFDCWIK